MLSQRLTRALDSGALELPARGRIGVFGARASDDLSALPPDRLQVIQGFRPDHDALAARGLDTATAPDGRYAAALVILPRARKRAEAMIAAAAAHTDGVVAVDGQKTDGIDTILRACRKRATVGEPVAKAHGKLFTFDAAGADVADWSAHPARLAGGFETLPGVFSADGPDPGSALLAQALPATLPGHVVDLGAGWGYLADAALSRSGVERLDLVEADHDALICAQHNIRDSRATFHWANAQHFAPESPADLVVMNPPFHTDRAEDPDLGRAFIRAAAQILAPHGVLWMVANRHLPYAATLEAYFRETSAELASKGFRIYRAARPVAGARPAGGRRCAPPVQRAQGKRG